MTLLTLAKAGEKNAWEKIVVLYSPLVRSWCRDRGIIGSDADDVLQEVFLCASKGLQNFRHDRPGDTFRGWLKAVARNMIALHYRKREKHPVAEGGTSHFQEIGQLASECQQPPEDDDHPTEIRELYLRAIDLVRQEFEDKTFRMFWAVTVDDRGVSDVAAEFGVSTAAVHKARSRFLRRLRQEIGDLPPD